VVSLKEVDQISEKRFNLQVIFDQILDNPKLSIKILGNLEKVKKIIVFVVSKNFFLV
jgi:hypothetical protein